MNIPFIKICGVTTETIAKEAVKAGANYIGLVFHPESHRAVTVDQAKQIARVTRQAGAEPVGIFGGTKIIRYVND